MNSKFLNSVLCLLKFSVALCLCGVLAFAADYYVDNSCASNGNGTTTACAAGTGQPGPFNSIANMQAKAGGYAAGDNIALKCGQMYRETFTVPSSGSAGTPITLTRYGTCTAANKPIIKGSNDYSGGATYKWTLSPTGTNEYYLEAAAGGNPAITQPSYVWINGVQAPDATKGTLDDHQSDWGLDPGGSFNTLYIRDDSGDPDVTGVLIEGSKRNQAILASAKSNLAVDNVVIEQTASYAAQFYTSGAGITVQNSACTGAPTCWYFANIADVIFLRNTSRDSVGNAAGLQFLGASAGTLTVAYSEFANSAGGISVQAGTSAAITNVTIAGMTGSNIENTGGAAVTVTNAALGASGSTYSMRNTGAGSLTYSYTNTLGSGLTTTNVCQNCTDGGNNTYVDPQWTANRRAGLYALYMDDSASLTMWTAMTDYANARGLHTTFGVSHGMVPGITTPSFWSTVATYAAAGNELACHTRSHPDLSSPNAFTIRYVGAGAAAVLNIDVANHRLWTVVDGSTDLDIDLSQAKYTTTSTNMSTLVADIDGLANYTATIQQYQDAARYLGLNDVSSQDIKTATYTVTFDETVPNGRRWVEEYDGCISDIETHVPGYDVKTLLVPYARMSTASTNAAATRFTAARMVDTGDYLLSNERIYNIRCYNTNIDSASQTSVKRSIWSQLDFFAAQGGVAGLFTHGWTGLSQTNWQYVIDAIVAYNGNGRVITFREIADHINGTQTGFLPTSVDADGNGQRWTRVWGAGGADYRLRASSPLIDAGTATAYTTDLLGNPIVGNPDMGAYEFQPNTLRRAIGGWR